MSQFEIFFCEELQLYKMEDVRLCRGEWIVEGEPAADQWEEIPVLIKDHCDLFVDKNGKHKELHNGNLNNMA